jgi:plasmid stabilization system protein ParE
VALVFHRLAAEEAQNARDWYSARSLRAAARFQSAVNAAAGRIVADPDSHALVVGSFRQVQVKGFPFALIYRCLSATDIVVVAVAHTSRRPRYWRRRE